MGRPKRLNPGRLMEISGFYWQTCTLHAAVKLDIFSAIGPGKRAEGELARTLGIPEQSLIRLLNALVAMGLITKEDAGYRNTAESAAFLSKDSPDYTGHMIMHHHHLVSSWAQLDQAVKKDGPVRSNVARDEEQLESFLMGMFNISMGTAPLLVPTLDFSGRKHLLDLGGGPGTYAIFFCRENPGLKAVVFDLPTTRPFAEKTIERFDLGDRVTFEPGDFITDTVTGLYDVVWLSHILHGEGPDDCELIIQKAADALEAGGMIIIHEFILDNTGDGPLFPALFSLNMLLGTHGGKSYTQGELSGMLKKAGFSDITRTQFKGPMESGLMTGIKR